MNHRAIRKAYPKVVTIDDGLGAFDSDGNLIELDEKLIAKAEKELAEELKIEENSKAAKKLAAEAKLAALGLDLEDLKALGIA